MDMTFRPMTPTERMYSYTQSQQLIMQTGCIGHLRADFGSDNKHFYSSWDDHRTDLKSDDFKQEFDEVIKALREDDKYWSVFKNRGSLLSLCTRTPEASFGNGREYGFRADTDHYSYMFRLNPGKGEYNIYCYCYLKQWLERHMKQAEKGIRFITPDYKELFRIADGDRVRYYTHGGDIREPTCRYIVSNAERYTSFLTTAANNYKYNFQEQLLIHAQKPDATACAEIEVWNKLGRWVNKGTKGIALLIDRDVPYRLRYVFDVSDTNSRAGREVSLWHMEERFEGTVIESLENSFGDIVSKHDFRTALMEAAFLVVTDNLPDYLADLNRVKQGSWLEELDDLNTEVWLKTTLQNSVAYMLMVRCGYDPRPYLTHEDFAHVVDFNTLETVSILGAATSDISEMVLREVGETVKGLHRAEKENRRTFESTPSHEYCALPRPRRQHDLTQVR